MNQEAILWIVGAVITLVTAAIGAVAAALWAHVGHCKEVAASVARMETMVERLSGEIGSHETGLRGSVHEIANRTTEYGMRLSMLERERR